MAIIAGRRQSIMSNNYNNNSYQSRSLFDLDYFIAGVAEVKEYSL
ncbi:5918_t:CDS:2 [Entrophospora sp. SA101]|nr:5918_t:CDS:2 [Entrophospora sp. SA101]